jgi:hypothetical protein
MPEPSCIWGYDFPRNFDIGDLPNRGETKPTKPTSELLLSNVDTVVTTESVTVGKIYLYNNSDNDANVTMSNGEDTPIVFLNAVPVPAKGVFTFTGPLYLEKGMIIKASANNVVRLQLFLQN